MDAQRTSDTFLLKTAFFGHRALLRDIAALRYQLEEINQYDSGQLKTLLRWYRNFRNMLERHHHAEDDYLFQELERRIGIPSAEIETIDLAHQRLQFLLDELYGLLQRAVAESPKQVADLLQARTAELQQLAQRHFRDEEALVVQLVTEHFGAQEQRRLEERLRRHAAFSYQIHFVPWVTDVLTAAERSALYHAVPWYVRWTVRYCTRPLHARQWRPVQD